MTPKKPTNELKYSSDARRDAKGADHKTDYRKTWWKGMDGRKA